MNVKKEMNMKKYLSIIAAAVILCAGCDNGDGDTKPTTITKSITVPAITDVTNPMEFGEVSALTGWDANFPHTDVTYTLTLSQGGSTKVTVNSTSATHISASGQADDVYTLTQTFYYKGNPIAGGSRTTGISIDSNEFYAFVVSEQELVLGTGFGTLNLSLR